MFFCFRSPAFCHNCTRCKGGENCGEMLREKEEGKRKEEGEPPFPFFPFLVRRRQCLPPTPLRTESSPPCIQYVYDASKDGGRKRKPANGFTPGAAPLTEKKWRYEIQQLGGKSGNNVTSRQIWAVYRAPDSKKAGRWRLSATLGETRALRSPKIPPRVLGLPPSLLGPFCVVVALTTRHRWQRRTIRRL